MVSMCYSTPRTSTHENLVDTTNPCAIPILVFSQNPDHWKFPSDPARDKLTSKEADAGSVVIQR